MNNIKRTTRTIYMKGNSCGNQYAIHNNNSYGTKWRITIERHPEYGARQIGNPILLDSNWDIDNNKIEKTNELFDNLFSGILI